MKRRRWDWEATTGDQSWSGSMWILESDKVGFGTGSTVRLCLFNLQNWSWCQGQEGNKIGGRRNFGGDHQWSPKPILPFSEHTLGLCFPDSLALKDGDMTVCSDE